jgi:hypothetical protein
VSVKTDIEFIDNLIDESGVPASVDLGGAVTIHNAVSGEFISPITYRRKGVPYRLLGRVRRYFVHDVVAFAKATVMDAPTRKPEPRRRYIPKATPQPIKSAPASAPVPIRAPPTSAARQRQPAIRHEKESETELEP